MCKILITAVRGLLFCKYVAVKIGPGPWDTILTGHKESVDFIFASQDYFNFCIKTNFQNRELGNPFIKTVYFFLESIFLNVGFTSEDLLGFIIHIQ